MYLLDTVAVSQSQKSERHSGYSDFVLGTAPEHKFISSVTLGELYFGLKLLPGGKRREALESWLLMTELDFAGRILPVDEEVAARWGALRAEMHKAGYTIALNDLLIAATALHHDLTVVTRNVRDFAPTGCKVLNPWKDDR